MKKLLILVNDPAAFLSHRSAVAFGAQSAGYEVHVASKGGDAVDVITGYGFKFHELPLSRSGMNPLVEIWSVLAILWLLWGVRPDVLHLVTLKPVLYGGVIARFAPVGSVVGAVAGLGFIFMGLSARVKITRWVVVALLKFAFANKRSLMIFQNSDDSQCFIDLHVVPESRTRLIRGSGVDLCSYSYAAEPNGSHLIVTFAARLLFDKGIQEYVDAASILKDRGIDAVFQIAGDIDPASPTSVSAEQLAKWSTYSNIRVLGFQKDMATVLSRSNLIVLPSYREGLPRVLVEAAACGRAVVTTDVPGCRDAITPNVTGLLVPVKNSDALADAIEKLFSTPGLRGEMGSAGRRLAEKHFAIDKIVQKHLDIYLECSL